MPPEHVGDELKQALDESDRDDLELYRPLARLGRAAAEELSEALHGLQRGVSPLLDLRCGVAVVSSSTSNVPLDPTLVPP